MARCTINIIALYMLTEEVGGGAKKGGKGAKGEGERKEKRKGKEGGRREEKRGREQGRKGKLAG